MTAETILAKLKRMYMATFDLNENADCAGRNVDLYGHFNVDNSRYVLSKKAKLWEANCQEHLFVQAAGSETELNLSMLQEMDSWLREKAEPGYVRNGEENPPKDHMYTYLTVVFITDKKISDDVKRFAKRYKFDRTYKWSLRGYMQTRLILVSTADNTVIANSSGKVLEKTYRKLLG